MSRYDKINLNRIVANRNHESKIKISALVTSICIMYASTYTITNVTGTHGKTNHFLTLEQENNHILFESVQNPKLKIGSLQLKLIFCIYKCRKIRNIISDK